MMVVTILIGKLIALISRMLNKGDGSTWPGHVALILQKKFIANIQKKSHVSILMVAGTNGKTTTVKILSTILQFQGKRVIQNSSGANLLNGIASTLLLHSNMLGIVQADYAIFEVDENIVSLLLEEITPSAVILLNLFRDQLDRYGELNSIIEKWKPAVQNLPPSTTLILNADDPQIAYLSKEVVAQVRYYGLDEQGTQTLQHASDALYCPQCNHKLSFNSYFYSHLGRWKCTACKLARPKPLITTSFYPLMGIYNKYNTLAAVAGARVCGLSSSSITTALHNVTPAFGRQEKINVNGKIMQIFLAKNPTSFNQTLTTIKAMGARYVLFMLNDRIPDGRDVSWIWDMDIENYTNNFLYIGVSGDRAYDMALRIFYANTTCNNISIHQSIQDAVTESIAQLPQKEILYVLPTYTAMLYLRKYLLGRHIL